MKSSENVCHCLRPSTTPASLRKMLRLCPTAASSLEASIDLSMALKSEEPPPAPNSSWRAVGSQTLLPLRVSKRPAPRNPTVFKGAQDHVPAAYCVFRSFLQLSEVADLDAWFASGLHPSIRTTDFAGDDLEAAAATAASSETAGDTGPVVRQLYRNPQPFVERFPGVYARLLALAHNVGSLIGLEATELERVTFCNDLRHITYRAPQDGCPWHRDDPASHFNTIFMLARPGEDFEGGNLVLHPGPCADPADASSVRLGQGDAVIYTAPLTDHMVETVTSGVRRICLVELQRRPDAS